MVLQKRSRIWSRQGRFLSLATVVVIWAGTAEIAGAQSPGVDRADPVHDPAAATPVVVQPLVWRYPARKQQWQRPRPDRWRPRSDRIQPYWRDARRQGPAHDRTYDRWPRDGRDWTAEADRRYRAWAWVERERGRTEPTWRTRAEDRYRRDDRWRRW